MIRSEFKALLHWIALCSPGSRQVEDADEAWFMIFEKAGMLTASMDDAKEAVAVVAGRQPFIAPAEVIAELRRVRRERIEHAVVPAPAIEDADGNEVSPLDYRRELHRSIARAAELHPMPSAKAEGIDYDPVYLGPGSKWRRGRDAAKAIAAPAPMADDPEARQALGAAKLVLDELPDGGATLLQAARDDLAMSGEEVTISALIITAARLVAEPARDVS